MTAEEGSWLPLLPVNAYGKSHAQGSVLSPLHCRKLQGCGESGPVSPLKVLIHLPSDLVGSHEFQSGERFQRSHSTLSKHPYLDLNTSIVMLLMWLLQEV